MAFYRFSFTAALLLFLLATNVNATITTTTKHGQNRNVLQHLVRKLHQVMTARSLVTNHYDEEGGDDKSPTTSLTSTSSSNTYKSAYNYNSGYSLGSSTGTTTSTLKAVYNDEDEPSTSEEESSSEEDDTEIEGSEEDEELPSSLSDEEDDAEMEGSEENDEREEAYPSTTEDAPSSEEDDEVPGEIEMQDADDVADEETGDLMMMDGDTDVDMLGSFAMGEENEMLMGFEEDNTLFGIDFTCFAKGKTENDCIEADPMNHEGCTWCRSTATPPPYYDDGACFPSIILQHAEAIPHFVCGDDVGRIIAPEEQETEYEFWATWERCVENGLGVDSCLDESSDCLWCQTYSDVEMAGEFGVCLSQASLVYADLLPEQWRNSLFSNYIGCTTEREQFEQEGEPTVSSILDTSCMGYDEGVNVEDLLKVATDLNAKDIVEMADSIVFGTFDLNLCKARVDAVGNPCVPTSIMGMMNFCLTQGQSNIVTSIVESLQSGEMSGMIKNQQDMLEEDGDGGGIFSILLQTLGTSLDGLEETMEATEEEALGFGESGSESSSSSSSMMLGGNSDTWSPYDENGNYVGHVGHDESHPITKELANEGEEEEEEGEEEEEEEEEEEDGVNYIGHVGEGSTLYNGTIPTDNEPFSFPEGDVETENEEAPMEDDGEEDEEEHEEEYGTSSGALPDGMLPPGVIAEEPPEEPVIDPSNMMLNRFKDGEKHSVQWDPEKEAFIWDDGMVILPPEQEEEDVPTKEIEDGSSTGEEEYGEEDVPTEDFGVDEEEVGISTEDEYGEEENLPTEDFGVDEEEEEILSEEGEEEEDVSREESEEEGESLEDEEDEEEYPTETESEEGPTESSSSSHSSSSSNTNKYGSSISSFQSQYPSSSSSTTKEMDNEDEEDQPEEGILDEPSEEEGEEPIDEAYGETSSETSEEEQSNYSTSEEGEYPLSEEEEPGESEEEESEEDYDVYGDTKEEESEYGDRENDEEYDEPIMTPLTEEDLSAVEMLKSEESEAIAEYVEGEEEYEEEKEESGYRHRSLRVRRV